MGLSWNSKMSPETLRLDVMTEGEGIATGNSLHFNIDGQIINLASYDEKSDVIVQEPFANRMIVSPGHVWVRKSYAVTPQLVDQMLQARKVTYRLDQFKDYLEGSLRDDPVSALAGFKDFLAEYKQAVQK
jgi:hypothetical protein